MKCPKCKAWTRVLETRSQYRVRECGNLHRFKTEELPVIDFEERKKQQEDLRREVANAQGTHQSVAEKYGVCIQSVVNWRKKYRTID